MTRSLTIVALLLLPSALPALHAVHRSGPATLELKCDNQRDDLALADLLTLSLTIEADQPITVEEWKPLSDKSAWTVVDRSRSRASKTETGRHRWQQSWFLAPAQPGDAVPLEVASLRWKQGDGDWQAATWPKQSMKVTTLIRQPDVKTLRETTSIEELPPQAESYSVSWLWLPAFVGVLVLATAWLRRRRASAQPRDACREALRTWDRLMQRRLPEQGRAERFVTLLTLILRQYLERRCQLPARRRTSAELLAAVRQTPALANQVEPLEVLLHRCDRVKYAHAELRAEECQPMADQVRALIVAIEKTVTMPVSNQIS